MMKNMFFFLLLCFHIKDIHRGTTVSVPFCRDYQLTGCVSFILSESSVKWTSDYSLTVQPYENNFRIFVVNSSAGDSVCTAQINYGKRILSSKRPK